MTHIDNGKLVTVGTKILMCSYKGSSLIIEELSDGGTLSAVKEVTTITCNHSDTLAGGEYIVISSPTTNYCIWFTKNNLGFRPPMQAVTFLKVNLYTGDNAAAVATKVAAVLDATGAFVSTATNTVVTCTNAVGGDVFAPYELNTNFILDVTTKGERKILFDASLGRNVVKVLDINIDVDGSAEILVETENKRTAMRENKIDTTYNYRAEYMSTSAGWLFAAPAGP